MTPLDQGTTQADRFGRIPQYVLQRHRQNGLLFSHVVHINPQKAFW